MFRKKVANYTPDVAERMQQHVHNMPIASVALAGLLGAGAVVLMTALHSSSHKHKVNE
jgi:hypothetical protein